MAPRGSAAAAGCFVVVVVGVKRRAVLARVGWVPADRVREDNGGARRRRSEGAGTEVEEGWRIGGCLAERVQSEASRAGCLSSESCAADYAGRRLTFVVEETRCAGAAGPRTARALASQTHAQRL